MSTLLLILLWCQQALGATLDVDAAVGLALDRSPAVAEARARVSEAEGALRAARGLRQDPTVQVSHAVVGELWSVSLSQPLSITGAGLADASAARHGLEAARSRLRRVELEEAAALRQLWVDAAVARQREDLSREGLAVAQRIEAAAAKREAVGEASLLDLRLARLQVEQARTAWMQATVEEGRLLAELGARLGVEAHDLALPDDPLAGVPDHPHEHPGELRADLQAAKAEEDAARAALSRERAETLPALRVGAFVEEEGQELRAGPRISATLPMWRGNVDGRSVASAELAAAEARRRELQGRVEAEQHESHEVLALLEQAAADQTTDLLGEARAALDSVALGYDRGELDLLSTALLQAEILEGQAAWLEGRRVLAEARLAGLLAQEDARLLQGAVSGGVATP